MARTPLLRVAPLVCPRPRQVPIVETC